MLRVQICFYFRPQLTLKPIIQGHPFFDIVHSDKWRVVAKRSELSALIVWGANREPYAASSTPSLLLTSVDLESYNSRSSIFGNNDKWRVVAKRSEIGAHIVWGANRKPYAASSNPSLLLTPIDLETYNSWSSIFGNNDKWRVVAEQSEISAHIAWGANRKPYAASSNSSLFLTSVDLDTYNSRSSVLGHRAQW